LRLGGVPAAGRTQLARRHRDVESSVPRRCLTRWRSRWSPAARSGGGAGGGRSMPSHLETRWGRVDTISSSNDRLVSTSPTVLSGSGWPSSRSASAANWRSSPSSSRSQCWARAVASSSLAGPCGLVAMATNGSDTPAPPPCCAETPGSPFAGSEGQAQGQAHRRRLSGLRCCVDGAGCG
jgi:hypothetical protein